MVTVLLRGAACKCPNCGDGALFRKFLKVRDNCDTCGEVLSHQRADDMPAYIVISIVGHIVIGLLLWGRRISLPTCGCISLSGSR